MYLKISKGEYSLPFSIDNTQIKRIVAPTHLETGNFGAIDWFMPENTPVLAAQDGIVDYRESRYNNFGGKDLLEKVNGLVLAHNNEEFSIYGHLKFRGVVVSKGEKVTQGQLIGFSGQTGFATYPHLHFEVYVLRKNFLPENLKIKFSDSTPKHYLDKIYRNVPPCKQI